MTFAMWFLAVSLAFFVIVIVNARVRKQVLIATTYISLTGWYYYRKWEKRAGTPPAGAKRKSRNVSNARSAGDSDTDVRFFEPADKVLKAERQRQDREERLSQHSASENSYRLSETSSSGQSEETSSKMSAPKKRSGIFGKLRKSERDAKSDSSRVSEVSVSSTASSAPTASRRTFSGRKKPPTWGE